MSILDQVRNECLSVKHVLVPSRIHMKRISIINYHSSKTQADAAIPQRSIFVLVLVLFLQDCLVLFWSPHSTMGYINRRQPRIDAR
jgi:hypothetical protein